MKSAFFCKLGVIFLCFDWVFFELRSFKQAQHDGKVDTSTRREMDYT